MIYVAVQLCYRWPEGPEHDAVVFRAWPGYGRTAAEVHGRVAGLLAGVDKLVGIRDDAGGEWPFHPETVGAVIVWEQ